MFEQKRILITAIGSMSGEAVIQSLKKKNYFLVGCNIYPAEWISASSMVDKFYQVPPANDPIKYIDAIIKICYSQQLNYIIPLTDLEVDLFSIHEDEFKKKSITICIPSKLTIDLCRDKFNLFNFFKEDSQVKVIPTYEISKCDLSNLKFPVVIKPKRGRSSEGKQVIHTYDELQCIASFRSGFIVQPYISGYIYVVDLVRNGKSGKTCTIQRRELLRTSNGAGTSIEITSEPQLDVISRYIGDKLQVNGCINMEFINHENDFYLMDINPRFSAGTAFSIMTGYDLVNNHLRCFTNEEIDNQHTYSFMIATKKFIEIITTKHPI